MQNKVMDLFETSFKAHANYVIPRIQNKSNREFYKASMLDILKMEEDVFSDFLIQLTLKGIKTELKNDKWYEFFNNKQKYTLLAIEHALEILYNLESRFIVGWTKDYR